MNPINQEAKNALNWILQYLQTKEVKENSVIPTLIEIIKILYDETQTEDTIKTAIADLKQLIDSSKHYYQEAITLLGYCYRYGLGLNQDSRLAAYCAKRAANLGSAAGEHALGVCYHRGLGVESDQFRAVEYFEKAANHGFSLALESLAVCYHNGLGVSEDIIHGIELYHCAYERIPCEKDSILFYLSYAYEQEDWPFFADPDGGASRRILLLQASKEEEEEEAKTLLEEEAENHQIITLENAIKHYQALSRHDRNALVTLAFCYQMGLGTIQDIEVALKLYQEAHSRGASCQFDIYLCYRILHERGTLDAKKCHEFYESLEREAKGSEESAALLSYLYEYGAPHLKQSLLKALEYYELAIKIKEGLKEKEEINSKLLGVRSYLSNYLQYLKQKDGSSPEVQNLLQIILDKTSSQKEIPKTVMNLKTLLDNQNPPNTDILNMLALCYQIGLGVSKIEKFSSKFRFLSAGLGNPFGQLLLGFHTLKELKSGLSEESRNSIMKTAFTYFSSSAKQGFAGAEYMLGSFFYFFGRWVNKDEQRAFELIENAASKGCTEAIYFLANYLPGDKCDPSKYESALIEGYVPALVQVAKGCLLKDQRHASQLLTEASFSEFKILTESDQLLAKCYKEGLGVRVDLNRFALLNGSKEPKSAVEEFKKLSEEGNLHTLTTLAFCYQMQLGTKRNLKLAIKLYRQAIQQGAICHWDLFFCYRKQFEMGLLKEADIQAFYKKLHDITEPDVEILLLLAYLYEHGAPGIEKNLVRASEYYDRTKILSSSPQVDLKLTSFLPLMSLRQTLSSHQKITNLIPDVEDLIAEYAFEPAKNISQDFFSEISMLEGSSRGVLGNMLI